MNNYEQLEIIQDKKTKKGRKISRQKDDVQDSKNIQTNSNELLRSKGGGFQNNKLKTTQRDMATPQ